MAVQKSRKSRSKRNNRRLHDVLKNPVFSFDHITKEIHLRHHITKNGYYRGKQIILDKNKDKDKKKNNI